MLSLIIPFYNDAGCPKPFVNALKKALEGIDYELILVDDCSKDSTPKELSELKSENVHVIYNKQNKDYGGAITTGLNRARGDILGFTCGDGEVRAEDIARVYKKRGNSNVIKAIRKNRQDGIDRKFISIVFNLMTRLRFGIDVEDINGYPLFMKREVYAQLTDLRQDWLFNLDMIKKILARGYKIDSVIISHNKRTAAESKMTPKRIFKMVIKYLKYK